VEGGANVFCFSFSSVWCFIGNSKEERERERERYLKCELYPIYLETTGKSEKTSKVTENIYIVIPRRERLCSFSSTTNFSFFFFFELKS
jgi:hypothetical protein